MKIFRLEHQHKWHIVDPRDHNHSLCRENFNANPQVAETTEMADQKLCNMCQSRGYKRGYLGVYPKVDIKGVKNPKRYRVIDNSDIEDYMKKNVYSHINMVETRYKPEKNWKETLEPDRTNVITDQPGHLADQFFGFLVENLKGKQTGKWTVDELKHELMSKTKHTYKQKDYWNKHFLGDIIDFKINLLYTIYPVSTYLKKIKKAGYDVVITFDYNTAFIDHHKVLAKLVSYAIVKSDGDHKLKINLRNKLMDDVPYGYRFNAEDLMENK